MLRRISTIFILSFLLVALMAMTAFSARTAYENAQKIDHKIDKSIYYAYPDETLRQDGSSSSILGRSTYSRSSASASPGVAIGDTWYDYQHNGTMGRMVDWGIHGTPDTVMVHFGWMRLQQPSFTDRHYGYSHYNAASGLVGAVVPVQPAGDYGGYVGMDVTSDNKAIPGGHNILGNIGATQAHLYWDFGPGIGFFNAQDRVDDSVASFAATPVQNVIWPKFAYQEGTATVTHVIAQVSAPNAADPQAIYYFRKVGVENAGSWDYPPYVIDTIYDLSHDIVASQTTDKVAMAWTANLTYTGVGNAQHPAGFQDDTLSGESPIHVQWDNDVYYQVSLDQGATWGNRVNLTKNRLGEAGYRAYTDLTTLIDSNDDLHVAWSGPAWPEDPAADGWSGFYCRLFMWSENIGAIRTVASAEWSTPNVDTLIECITGAWNVAMAKMQVSECDGKLYVLWTQHLDPPNGIFDDCAARADGGNGDVAGATNGELFISVSADYGLTFDAPRNLTNSYSKDCDPSTGGLDCDSDVWPSMAQFGRQNGAGENWTGAVVVDPGASGTDHFLDIQYVHDVDAGGIVQNEGTWQNSDMNWFRLACVEPVPNPQIILSLSSIQFPTWAKPGVSINEPLTIENTGNVNLTYSTSVEMDNNAGMNWLGLTGFSGTVPSGLSNVETGQIDLGSGTTTNGGYIGRIIFTSNAPTSPDTIPVSFTVADTVIPMVFDTIESGCLALTVANTGNYGNSGVGLANMDWVFSGSDCDTSGAADVYLYDGSPVIAWIDGVDTMAAWSIFGDGWLATNGFKPQGGEESGSEAAYNWYSTGKFVTPDSTIGMSKTWYANTSGADCDYMVQKLSVWAEDGIAKSGLVIGEAIDWDVPSDSGAQNTSGFSPIPNLIYQSGAEYGVDTVCQDSDTRHGGIAFFEGYLNGSLTQSAPYGAYTGRNDSLVFPAGNFIPAQLHDFMTGNSGFTTELPAGGPTPTDLHTVMTFNNALSLGAADTAVFWVVMATVENGTVADLETAIADGKQFITDNSYFAGGGTCCVGAIRGNVDNDPGDNIDIADLVYFVAFSFAGGPAPVCDVEADVDATTTLDIGDIVYLVAYSFAGGPAPLPCP